MKRFAAALLLLSLFMVVGCTEDNTGKKAPKTDNSKAPVTTPATPEKGK